ncbi:MAG: hypothetical protein ACP5E4_00985 [Candidatus Aenigmatarchaeota archaeon]
MTSSKLLEMYNDSLTLQVHPRKYPGKFYNPYMRYRKSPDGNVCIDSCDTPEGDGNLTLPIKLPSREDRLSLLGAINKVLLEGSSCQKIVTSNGEGLIFGKQTMMETLVKPVEYFYLKRDEHESGYGFMAEDMFRLRDVLVRW